FPYTTLFRSAVVGDQCVAIQRVLHEQSDVGRVGVVADLDVVPDVADAGQPGDGQLGRGPLRAVFDGAGQLHVALVRGRLHPVRHGDVRRERVVRRRGQHRVIAVVARR